MYIQADTYNDTDESLIALLVYALLLRHINCLVGGPPRSLVEIYLS
jgi:hypothetical protein